MLSLFSLLLTLVQINYCQKLTIAPHNLKLDIRKWEKNQSFDLNPLMRCIFRNTFCFILVYKCSACCCIVQRPSYLTLRNKEVNLSEQVQDQSHLILPGFPSCRADPAGWLTAVLNSLTRSQPGQQGGREGGHQGQLSPPARSPQPQLIPGPFLPPKG